jgi:hypothetical protein
VAVDPDCTRLRHSVSVLTMTVTRANARADSLTRQHEHDVRALHQALGEVDGLR